MKFRDKSCFLSYPISIKRSPIFHFTPGADLLAGVYACNDENTAGATVME